MSPALLPEHPLDVSLRTVSRNLSALRRFWLRTLCMVLAVHWRRKVRVFDVGGLSLTTVSARLIAMERLAALVHWQLDGIKRCALDVGDKRRLVQAVRLERRLVRQFVDERYQRLACRFLTGTLRDVDRGVIEADGDVTGYDFELLAGPRSA